MVLKDRIPLSRVLDKMILSASGWRGIFAENGDEESKTGKISDEHRIICAAAASVFADYLGSKPVILLGTDTRPTGKAIVDAMIPVLLNRGCDVRYAGFIAAPEIMAWARSLGISPEKPAGFIYISASHNPIGHNGIKFGLTDGGVLAAQESAKLIADFRAFLAGEENIKIESCVSELNTKEAKSQAQKIYYDFCADVTWNGSSEIAAALKEGLKKNPLGIVCDFNGSARTTSIDKDFFTGLGIKFDSINSEPGQIVHRIVPEGDALNFCIELLEKTHKTDASFVLGYVPDCDGDRGNLVIWDNKKACALGACAPGACALGAQEVFALACVAELSHLVWTGGKLNNCAVVINDPTSMRIDRIAEAFGASIFRAEVGEANVVSLARKLRSEGYAVRILGEGSAGGNITHPSAVRDPLHTVMAIAKLLSIRTVNGKKGLFEIWCDASRQKYREDFTLADIIASLPPFTTTSAYSEDAIMRISTQDQTLLKDRYQQIFLNEWEVRKDELKTRFNIHIWEAIAYNGMIETRNLNQFKNAKKGGLKILFKDENGREIAYIWMRGSATEPVFRIIADAQEPDNRLERYLLEWQRCMIMKADNFKE